MNNPKISVIVPVYNAKKYLSECLDSIVNQTLKDIEIICVNDGSTDNSLAILNEYKSKDNRIKIIDKENEGQGYARKVGLDVATGEYILFCDSDDYYAELTAFEKLYNCAEDKKTDLVVFDFYRSIFNNKIKILWLPENLNKEIFLYNDINNIYEINTSASLKFYSKEFLDRYNDWYFPKKIFYEDTPFHFQSIFRAESVYYYKRAFYVYVRRDNSSTTKFKTDKNFVDVFTITKVTLDIVINSQFDNSEKLKDQLLIYFLNKLNMRFDRAFLNIQNAEYVINSINLFDLSDTDKFVYKNVERKIFFIYKAIKRFTPEQFRDYINKKQLKEYYIKIQQDSKTIQEQNLSIERLQKSGAYIIGRVITYPFSIFLEFFRFIHDYNLLKKSDLFDSEYYLSQNEDVKKAKIDPIKHYLKFGWKEGRNPSEKFDGNEYLDQRPNVRIIGICPLVHYLKVGKDEK